jgi:hypothetical protein
MLRKSWIPLALLVLASPAWASAQEPHVARRSTEPFVDHGGHVATSGMVKPTVAMWFYEQELQRHNDPKTAIRRRAEFRAQQRQGRLAAMRWYGKSNSRPMASPTPFPSGYSAYWGSNTYNPQRWQPAGATTVVVRPTAPPR